MQGRSQKFFIGEGQARGGGGGGGGGVGGWQEPPDFFVK